MDCTECPICMLPMSRKLRFLKCPHKICLDCGVRWLYKKNICPICRLSSCNFLVFDSHKPKNSLSSLTDTDYPLKLENIENSNKNQLENLNVSNNKSEISKGVDKTVNEELHNKVYYEKTMSISELISTYWEQITALSKQELNDENKTEPENELEDIDISLFEGNLNEIIFLTTSIWNNMVDFDSHIFYSELYDIIEDIHRTNNFYQECLIERDPSVSKYRFACYVEHIFKFLESLNQSIIQRDTEMITYLISIVDQVYYNSYMEYYFRDSIEDQEDDNELGFD